ncbi:MAG TPA: hypothetical protein PKA06_09890, partial [Gemmatales bacterium]|nr:hypothetical protein [Gemmatales bacterium]
MKWFLSTLLVLHIVCVLIGHDNCSAQIVVFPEQIHLKGSDDSRQLIITRQGSEPLDITRQAKVVIADPTLAKSLPDGRILPLANGTTTITIED